MTAQVDLKAIKWILDQIESAWSLIDGLDGDINRYLLREAKSDLSGAHRRLLEFSADNTGGFQ